MNESEENPEEIKRILVAIDGSPHSLAALKLAGELASRIGAELLGLYVEDVNLLRVAELPISREVGFYSARVRDMDVRRIQRQLRAQARRAEQALALIAESAEVGWSFRVAHGLISTELLAAAAEADLIILGKAGWSRRKRLGSTAKTIVIHSERHVLVFQSGVRLSRPVVVVYDGSPASKKALEASLNMREADSPLMVLISAEDAEEMRSLQMEVQEWAQKNGVFPQYRWLTEIDEEIIARQAWSISCGVLILPTQIEFIPSEKLLALLDQTDCAVYLVR